jgi:hypothetical protein
LHIPEDKTTYDNTVYTEHYWIQGEYVAEYNQSAISWKAHTSTDAFAKAFD